jgi:hypothetical protein
MAIKVKQVGRLKVKCDPEAYDTMPLVTVCSPGLVETQVYDVDCTGKTCEQAVAEAVSWAEVNQDKAGDGCGGLFG